MDATPFLPPPSAGKRKLAAAVQECRGCPLWRGATQAVFGEGPLKASVVLVGEQPGDREDREGRPFVGPAGRELDRVLELADIDRDTTYVTNVDSPLAPLVVATIHPSAILRARDDDERRELRASMVADLRAIAG